MGVFQLCGVALGGMFLVLLLRQYRPEYALLLSLALAVLLLTQILGLLARLQETLQTMFPWFFGEQYGAVLRTAGAALAVQTTAELCREAGQPSLENKVLLAGKLLILSAALPLIGRILHILSELLQ